MLGFRFTSLQAIKIIVTALTAWTPLPTIPTSIKPARPLSIMKIKAISRSIESYAAPGSSTTKSPRNLDTALHPFERAREYTRALQATKLERVFAAPFIGQLGLGHTDGVYSLCQKKDDVETFASGSGDGVIKVWDLSTKNETWSTTGHENIVKGMTWTRDGKLLTCASDRTIKLWDPTTPNNSPPLNTFLGNSAFTSLSHHRSRNIFAASSGMNISIYDLERQGAAAETLSWPQNIDTINRVCFNQVETSLLLSTSSDRSMVLYDLRTNTAVGRTFLNFACNSLSWNPMEGFNAAVASEDHNVYLFDLRRTDKALNILKGHVSAVMDVDFSPTGQELVTASYDRTVRLWEQMKGHSRDVYHTKRMQRVFCAAFTPDSKYVLSGSDDGNVRLWRAQASKREGMMSGRQRQALEYNEALSNRYAHMPEIRRIKRHRHIPKVVKKAGEIKGEELKSIKRREENERKHTKKQFEKRRSEREKVVLAKEQ
ncbi:putative Sof1-like protein domain-containing protein [Seiridium unicorne]|uniref:Sof1-like protein domain-containing protein n=1 Tax=Seiridium unicorne TaxID=138068 RepID=A0ABR2VCI7_9PEZI